MYITESDSINSEMNITNFRCRHYHSTRNIRDNNEEHKYIRFPYQDNISLQLDSRLLFAEPNSQSERSNPTEEKVVYTL